MQQVGRIASGYVYYVSLKGVTGAGHLDTAAVADDAAAHPRAREACRSASASASATRRPRKAVAAVADAVVIGSPPGADCSKRRRATMWPPRRAAFIAEIRAALDALTKERSA